ncbi:DUF7344 domain-containing protein [Haloarcula onubensis]|uniref:DUF7344 domain-containing protein n=1 Tax=Haloarcula onubensis TaxID=2950539 RepID=A0ABU2FWF2_9EURY|nr:hypothetical protein [Halomicroarcula sp. S3CR25-11]MDS0284612.1 hypothetical protein [Halomicroarcula sp. S3CR25-11]
MFTDLSAGDGTTDEKPIDDLLSDPHCRHLLTVLRERDRPTGVSTASRHIVSEMTDSPVDQVPANVERRVQTWLHHGLLPTLDDRGVVAFDPERRTVTLTDPTLVP